MIHPAANEASIRHLAARLERAEIELAIVVGNLAWKDTVIAELEQRVAQHEDLKLTQPSD